jgi:hypothetical protein
MPQMNRGFAPCAAAPTTAHSTRRRRFTGSCRCPARSDTRGRHEQLIAQLNHPMIHSHDEKHRLSKAIARDLMELRDARVISDYHLDARVDHELASESTRLALNVLKTTT